MTKHTLINTLLLLLLLTVMPGFLSTIYAEEPKSDVTQTESSTMEGEPSTEEPPASKTAEPEPDAAEQNVSQSDTEQSRGTVARAQFTTAMQDREPSDDIVMLDNNSDKVYFFTELIDLKGSTITHRWEYQGKTMAEVNFNVGGDRWRVFSSKNIKPEWTGVWSVVILNEEGIPLKMSSFEVIAADSAQ